MNAKPHQHDLVIRACVDCCSATEIRYGDQHRQHVLTIHFPISYQWRLKRKIKRIVRRHDKASVRAGRQHDIRHELMNESVPTRWAIGAANDDEQKREEARKRLAEAYGCVIQDNRAIFQINPGSMFSGRMPDA